MGSALLFTTTEGYLLQTENILDLGGQIIAGKRFENVLYSGKYFFYRYDVRGSVTNILGTDGSVVKNYEYDEFGNTTRGGDGSFKNDVTFTGSISDSASGLQYMNARYYNSSTGRFITQDTYTGSVTEPLTQHLYSYCGNNPINMVDPTGHDPVSILLLLLLALAAGATAVGCSAQQEREYIDLSPTPTPKATTAPTMKIDPFKYNWTGEHVTEDFLNKVVDVSNMLEINPDDLMAVMAFESKLDPSTKNSIGATGLIQFMPETAKGLGTTTDELANMSAVDQMDYVYLHMKRFAGKMLTLSDVYMSVLLPKAVGKEESYVLWSEGTKAYTQNKGLDIDGDGNITKSEATQKVRDRRETYQLK